jgi:hypothetical protein
MLWRISEENNNHMKENTITNDEISIEHNIITNNKISIEHKIITKDELWYFAQ